MIQIPHPDPNGIAVIKPDRPGIAIVTRRSSFHSGLYGEPQQATPTELQSPGIWVREDVADQRTDLG